MPKFWLFLHREYNCFVDYLLTLFKIMAAPVTKKQSTKEKLVNDVAKWNKSETTNEELINNLEDKTNKQANRNSNFSYFLWEESLINKFIENDPSITFDDIKDEWINLALLQYDDWKQSFINCFNKIKNNEIKKAFVQEIFDKVKNEIWSNTPYNDFSTECDISNLLMWTDIDVPSYFQKVVDYLDNKEKIWWIKKTVKVLKKIIIKNEDLNWKLPIWEQIPTWIPLMDKNIPTNTIKSFDALLSLEIGKESDNKVNTANNISNKIEDLFSNTFPAINTIIGEDEKYKYDENKLWLEFQSKLQAIANDKNLNNSEEEKQINDLKWEYYISYLKGIDTKIGNTIEQLYNNNFDYSKLDEKTLNDYLDKISDIRLKALSENGINETLKLILGDNDIEKFSKFYKELANPNIKEMCIDCKSTWWTSSPNDIRIPIEKNIISNKNLLLMNIEGFWNNKKSHDCIPFQYKIKKNDIEKLSIDKNDKINLMNFLSKHKSEEDEENYIINWEDAWNLIYLFFVVNGKINISHIDPEKEKEVKELIWNNDKTEKNNIQWKENTKEEKINDIKNFINNIEKWWFWNKFENWSEIWLPMWDSELPWWWYQWMKIKINNIDKKKWTFTWKVFWWELKFTKDIEWKSKKFVMNEETLNKIGNTSKDPNKIWLLPNPEKWDFNSHKDKLNGKLWTWNISLPDGIKWDGQRFMHNVINEKWKEIEQEVKHFWIPWNDTVSYNIKYNPSNRSFNVSTTYNWTAKKNNWKSENVRYSYSRDMDWNNFLIFFTQKWLIPQSEEASQKAQIKQDEEFKVVNGWHRKLNWFSINNIKNVFKNIKWNIKKKIDDYNKGQDEKLQDILIWDRWLYGKLSHILWFIPSIEEWLWELEQEYYNERDNRTRKKIKYYYEKFCADYDLPDTFDQEPPYIKMRWKWSLKDQVLNRVINANDRIKWDAWLYQAAWLLLANIEKWWSPYRWLSWHENEGLWIKALLGNGHYKNFLKQKQKCIDAFSTEENKDKLQDALANSEMTYIINNIYWKDKWLLFWNIESRWLPINSDNTNYIENPSKKILSEQFAKKLDDLTKDNFTKDGVIGKMPKHNYFEKAENDFYRLIKSSRFSGAMSELEWMISLARTDTQVYATKKCYLILMLSGILDFNWNKWLRKLAYTQWKTFGFAPAMLAKNIWHSEEIALLLDDFSGWDFSKNVKAYCHKKDLLNWKTDIKNLIDQVNNRFNEEKMKEFDEYVESIPWKNWEWKSPALRKLQKDLTDYDNQNPDDIVLKNAKLINSAWLNASADAVATRLRIDKWEFVWKDQDEKADIQAFWKSCSEKIKNATNNLNWPGWAKHAIQMLEKYLWWFWINWDNKQAVYKRISTAHRYESQINSSWKSDTKWKYCQITQRENTLNKEWKEIEIDVPLWKLYDSDVKKILRYGLEWFVRTHRLSSQQLPSELKRTLDEFQKFFEKAFYNGYFDDISNKVETEVKIFHLWWWDVYETIAQKNNDINYINSDEDDAIESADFKLLDKKVQKVLLRKIFNSDNYKNADMSAMRKSLKNHWIPLADNEWGLFNDTSREWENLQQYL